MKVNAGHLRNLQLDLVADLGLEALYFHPEAVESRKQSGEHVVARAIRLHLPREIRLWIGDRDVRSCHHGAGGVGNYPGDLALRLDRTNEAGHSEKPGTARLLESAW